MGQSTLSYRQLYKLFGYNKELDIEAIINELLYSISDVKCLEASPTCDFSFHDHGSMAMLPYRVFDKKCLPPYLEHKTGIKSLMRMDARLHALHIKYKELKNLKWFKFCQWFKIRREIFKLSSQMIAIKDVFAFFAYRAKRMGLPISKLHKQITDTAETYHTPDECLCF